MALILSGGKARKSEYIFGGNPTGGRCTGKLVLSKDDLEGFTQMTLTVETGSSDTCSGNGFNYIADNLSTLTGASSGTVGTATNIPSVTNYLTVSANGNNSSLTSEPGLIMKLTLS